MHLLVVTVRNMEPSWVLMILLGTAGFCGGTDSSGLLRISVLKPALLDNLNFYTFEEVSMTSKIQCGIR